MSEVLAASGEDQDITETKMEPFESAGSKENIKKAAQMILAAKNPVILAGAGAMGGSAQIQELVENYGIPLATTLRGKGIIPEDHDLCLGCLGLYGTNAANKYLRSGIDVMLAVGTSFSEFTTHAWDSRFQPVNALIQVEIDSWEMAKNYRTTVGIMGNSKLVLGQLLEEMKNWGKPSSLIDRQKIIEFKKQREYFADPNMKEAGLPLKAQYFLNSLRNLLDKDVIVFGDIGNCLPWIEGFFQVYKPNTFFICSSLASMGYGVSASIGGQLAAPDKQVICICGDGDLQMQAMEIVTAVNYNIPVKWLIFNNQKLGMIKDLQNVLFKGRIIASEFINPDFVKLAEAMGAVGLRITKSEDIAPIMQEAMGNNKPTVIDVIIDPDEMPAYDARAEAMSRAWGASASFFAKLKLLPSLIKRM